MQDIRDIPNTVRNQTIAEDAAVHGWYQFVLGYPPHLVRHFLQKFNVQAESRVLDPFCGTGTTVVECKKLGYSSTGVEANPIAAFASRVKTEWSLDSETLRVEAQKIAVAAHFEFEKNHLVDAFSPEFEFSAVKEPSTRIELSEEELKILPKGFISERPLRKVLILRSLISGRNDERVRDLMILALANVAVSVAGNVAFGPEIYSTKPKRDAPVLNAFYEALIRMAHDLSIVDRGSTESHIILSDSRDMNRSLERVSSKFDIVITSPPYPNEKDYTRTTRLESVLLGFLRSKEDLRRLKENLLRSNSRNVFVDDADDIFVKDFSSITKLADSIEAKRLRLGKTSGFEKLYHKIVRHYFGGMHRHLSSLRPHLNQGARLAYVVGDQMSFFRKNIPTAKLLGEIAEATGYKVVGIELWRTRLATATKRQLDENVLLLENH